MRSILFTALLATLFAAPAVADDWKVKGGKGWKGYGDDWVSRNWRWDDDEWDDDDWDERDRNRWRTWYDDSQPANRNYLYGRVYVDSNGLRGYIQQNGMPAAGELSELDYRSLRRAMRGSAVDFDRWLSGIPAGEVWRRHFETRTIQH